MIHGLPIPGSRRRGQGRAAGLALLILLVAAPAAAGEPELVTIEARGEAPAGAADPRTAALDAAFVDAVGRALARQADPQQLARRRQAIDAEILARPRRFIASFKTLGSETVQGRMIIRVQARVDVGRLRAALVELGIATGGAARPRGRPRVLVLVGGPAAAPLIRELTEQGFPAVAPRDDQRPVDDPAAMRAARAAGAGAVIIGNAQVEADRPVRGTNLKAAVAQARLRLVDAESGDAVASAEISEAGYGDGPETAAAAAARALAIRAARALAQPAARRWPEARGSASSGLAVVIRGATRWPTIEAIRATLAGIPGVSRAWVRRAGRGEIELTIEGSPAADRVAGALRTAALPRGALRVVAAAGERVEVAVDGDGAGQD